MSMMFQYAIVMLMIAAHLFWQVWRLDLQKPSNSFNNYLQNILIGVLMVVAAMAGTL